jgi:hypothetical protein
MRSRSIPARAAFAQFIGGMVNGWGNAVEARVERIAAGDHGLTKEVF